MSVVFAGTVQNDFFIICGFENLNMYGLNRNPQFKRMQVKDERDCTL